MEMMDLNIVIDEMSVDDLSVISDIERRSYDFPWSKNIFNDCLLSGYKCIVARKNEVLMGYAVLTLSSNEAQILNLCVDQKYRNLGFGEKILDFLTLVVVMGGWYEKCQKNPLVSKQLELTKVK